MTTKTVNETLADACEEVILSRRHVTFVELGAVLKRHGVDPWGPIGMESERCPNLFYWAGSDTFIEVVHEVLRRGRVAMSPASSPLVYWIDGGGMTLPIAKRLPKNGYKEPHWVPVVFNPTNTQGAQK